MLETDKKTLTVFVIIVVIFTLPISGFIYLVATDPFTDWNFNGTQVLCVSAVFYTGLTFLLFHAWEWLKPLVRYIVFGILTGVPLLLFTVITAGKIYHGSIDTVRQNLNLWDYAPFIENTKAVSLDEASVLKLTQNLPRLDGATAFYPVYSAFVQAVYPTADYRLQTENNPLWCTTTPWAYDRLIQGETDIIFVLAPSDEQLASAEEAGIELVFTPIGREAFVFFVNSRNRVSGLTSEQVRLIYSGEITNWREAGGRRSQITAYQRNYNSGSQTAMIDFMRDVPLASPPIEIINDMMMGIIEDVADYKNYNNAIGYSFLFFATEMAGNKQIKLLAIDGVEPTRENVTNGTYQPANDFYAVTVKDCENPNVELFIEWILSEQGQELVEKTGYTRVN